MIKLISIHAPPRGATVKSRNPHILPTFQFTPLREGRLAQAELSRANQQFQFTPLREGRHVHRPPIPNGSIISIHAPPRGATVEKNNVIGVICISIHAPPRGATQCLGICAGNRHSFQFTPLREGRPDCSQMHHGRKYFNSRPSARGDFFRPFCRNQLSYFNSRPSARGDYPLPCGAVAWSISIHAPPRGATYWLIQIHIFQYFNSRPSAMGDNLYNKHIST